MRFEGLFQKENQMYQWKFYANGAIFSKCYFESFLLYRVGVEGRGILGCFLKFN